LGIMLSQPPKVQFDQTNLCAKSTHAVVLSIPR
jgi:hypothetical protein